MIAIVAVRRHALAGCLAVFALSLSLSSSAGFLTTERTVANFVFKDGAVDYRPERGAYFQSGGGVVSPLAERLPDFGGESGKPFDPLSGALFLDAKPDNYGNFDTRDFNVFGSLPPAESLPDAELLARPLKVVSADGKDGALYRLIDRVPIVGPRASQYRGAGIYTQIAGIDETVWIAGYRDAESTNRLLALEDAAVDGRLPAGALAVPLPGSAVLLAAGLPWLIRRDRRRGRQPDPRRSPRFLHNLSAIRDLVPW